MNSSAEGRDELGNALLRFRTAFVTILLISAVLNVLLLGSSFYMMLVYDSVLPSRSLPTLIGLFGMVALVYLFQAYFDTMRSQILSDVGAGVDRAFSARVQQAIGQAQLRGVELPGGGLAAMRDLDSLRAFLSSGGPSAFFDLPWVVFFLAVLFMLHIWLGVTALIGSVAMLALTWLTDRATRIPTLRLSQVTARRNEMAETNLRHVEVLTALGMRSGAHHRWALVNQTFLAANESLARTASKFGGISKALRLFIQSLLLTVGALLVIDGQASGGIIFAASMLSGRALAPVDLAIANWRGFAAARTGYMRLQTLFALIPAEKTAIVSLPDPKECLQADQLYVRPPGAKRLTVQGASFELKAGSGLGIIGPSGAGKTSLGRALVGLWQPAQGSVRLDGATLDQWQSDALGQHIGYLSQSVELFEGTVAENIARFAPEIDSPMVVAAAQKAGVHHLIVNLPQGYETPVGSGGMELSAGQRQRIGLARALYGDPFLVLLDEPNSNLDLEGEVALERAIASVRARGGIVIVISHRSSALSQVDRILLMREGRMVQFGPRDEVLAKVSGENSAPRPAKRAAAVAPTVGLKGAA